MLFFNFSSMFLSFKMFFGKFVFLFKIFQILKWCVVLKRYFLGLVYFLAAQRV